MERIVATTFIFLLRAYFILARLHKHTRRFSPSRFNIARDFRISQINPDNIRYLVLNARIQNVDLRRYTARASKINERMYI